VRSLNRSSLYQFFQIFFRKFFSIFFENLNCVISVCFLADYKDRYLCVLVTNSIRLQFSILSIFEILVPENKITRARKMTSISRSNLNQFLPPKWSNYIFLSSFSRLIFQYHFLFRVIFSGSFFQGHFFRVIFFRIIFRVIFSGSFFQDHFQGHFFRVIFQRHFFRVIFSG